MTPGKKQAFEPTGLIPRSIVRTFERFYKQLLPKTKYSAIREYRISRYQVLVSIRCLCTLLILPLVTRIIAAGLIFPQIQYFWNVTYQDEHVFSEIDQFSQVIFFDSLLDQGSLKQDFTPVSSLWNELVTDKHGPDQVAMVRCISNADLCKFENNYPRSDYVPRSSSEVSNSSSNCYSRLYSTRPLETTCSFSSPMIRCPTHPYIALPPSILTEQSYVNTDAMQQVRAPAGGLKESTNQRLTVHKMSVSKGGFEIIEDFNKRSPIPIEKKPAIGAKEQATIYNKKMLLASTNRRFVTLTSPKGYVKSCVRPQGFPKENLFRRNKVSNKEFYVNGLEDKVPLVRIAELKNKAIRPQVDQALQEKIFELAQSSHFHALQSLTNVFADLLSIVVLIFLLITLRPEITILKSFLVEVIYNLSDTTKSFLLILMTDLLVGFHSPRGWETMFSLILYHFGLPENQDFVFLFVATLPVILDTVFKYWIFRHLNKISPSTVATYHNMIE